MTKVGAPPSVGAANPRRRGVLPGRVDQTCKRRPIGCDLQAEGQRKDLPTVAAPKRAIDGAATFLGKVTSHWGGR